MVYWMIVCIRSTWKIHQHQHIAAFQMGVEEMFGSHDIRRPWTRSRSSQLGTFRPPGRGQLVLKLCPMGLEEDAGTGLSACVPINILKES